MPVQYNLANGMNVSCWKGIVSLLNGAAVVEVRSSLLTLCMGRGDSLQCGFLTKI